MKKYFFILTSVLFFLSITSIESMAQNGLENIIVEKYYISNLNDSLGSDGILPVGSITYRVFVDMLPGYKFQMAYGSSTHPMIISTSTSFFNNEDRGAIFPTYTKNQAKNNTVMLDTWLSAGAACVGNFGVLKTEDDSIGTVINADGILQNADTAAGVPLIVQDGFIAGNPGICGIIGLDTATAIFDATSQLGNLFETTNGAWYCLAGAMGPDTNTNKVLIGQFTTNGQFKFNLNIQIGTPIGDIEKYVWNNPIGNEILLNGLIYVADTNNSSDVSSQVLDENSISIFPNPSNGVYWVKCSGQENKELSYTIYDILGHSIFTKKIDSYSNPIKVDISGRREGIYFIELHLSGNKRLTYKLIKS